MRTVSGGQFDWGGRLPKGNGGAQRFVQHGRKSCNECKRINEPNCDTDGWSSNAWSMNEWHKRGASDCLPQTQVPAKAKADV